MCEALQFPEGRWNGAIQIVAIQIDLSHFLGRWVAGDAMPFTNSNPVRYPIVVLFPAVSVGRVVESNQDFFFRHGIGSRYHGD